jgi:hypothetical protein
MNDNSFLDDLLSAARQSEPRDTSRAEYGFETRLLARLREERGGSVTAWAWKMCPFFAVIALAAGLWSQSAGVRWQAEANLFASAARQSDTQLLVTYITGDSE